MAGACFINADPAIAEGEVFRVAGAEFQPHNAHGLDPYMKHIRWSRRFMGGLRACFWRSPAGPGWAG